MAIAACAGGADTHSQVLLLEAVDLNYTNSYIMSTASCDLYTGTDYTCGTTVLPYYCTYQVFWICYMLALG